MREKSALNAVAAPKLGVFFSPQCFPIGKQAERFICPDCGAGYPAPGTCHGFGPDKHPARKVAAR